MKKIRNEKIKNGEKYKLRKIKGENNKYWWYIKVSDIFIVFGLHNCEGKIIDFKIGYLGMSSRLESSLLKRDLTALSPLI